MRKVGLEVEKESGESFYLNADKKTRVGGSVEAMAVLVGPTRRIFVWQ
jgi:hypothetical protein